MINKIFKWNFPCRDFLKYLTRKYIFYELDKNKIGLLTLYKCSFADTSSCDDAMFNLHLFK